MVQTKICNPNPKGLCTNLILLCNARWDLHVSRTACCRYNCCCSVLILQWQLRLHLFCCCCGCGCSCGCGCGCTCLVGVAAVVAVVALIVMALQHCRGVATAVVALQRQSWLHYWELLCCCSSARLTCARGLHLPTCVRE